MYIYSFLYRGSFGGVEFCDFNHYAVGFDLQYAPLCKSRCAKDDDVGLMAIRLYLHLSRSISKMLLTRTSKAIVF